MTVKAERRPEELIHGRVATYTNYVCRCPACKAAKAKNRRAHYLKSKVDEAIAQANEELR